MTLTMKFLDLRRGRHSFPSRESCAKMIARRKVSQNHFLKGNKWCQNPPPQKGERILKDNRFFEIWRKSGGAGIRFALGG